MFDPIKGPNNEFEGPAVGHTTEKGDSWHTAVAKINAGFASIKKSLIGGAAVAVEAIDTDARNAFNALRTAHDQLVHDYGNLAQKFVAMSAEVEEIKAHLGALPTAPPPPNPADLEAAVAAALSAGA